MLKKTQDYSEHFLKQTENSLCVMLYSGQRPARTSDPRALIPEKRVELAIAFA